MIRTLRQLRPYPPPPDVSRETILRGSGMPPRRWDASFAANILDSIWIGPIESDPRLPRLYNWKPALEHLGQMPLYKLIFSYNGDGSVNTSVPPYWGTSINESRAINYAETNAYDQHLQYPYTPYGMPVTMHVSYICPQAIIPPPVGDGTHSGGSFVGPAPGDPAPADGTIDPLPDGGPARCFFKYWFYHYSDPLSVLCPVP